MPIVGQTGSADTRNNAAVVVNQNLRYKIVGSHFLHQLSEGDILNDIAQRIADGRRLIIPVGLPQAGKSMFIASLIAYAFQRDEKEDNSCNFMNVVPREVSGIKNITDALSQRNLLPSTRPNEITIVDLDMKSRYRNRKIKVSLIDLSGEDIKSLIAGGNADNQDTIGKIGNILNACIAQRAIFAILTPVDEKIIELGRESDFDKEEDAVMKAFIDKVRSDNPRLYDLTKFLIVITKWDKLPKSTSSSNYLQLHRNQLYNELTSNSKSYGLLPYSVGDVVSNKIMRIVLRSPKNFWYTLYRWCTGKHVLPWWKRLFS